MQVDLSRRIAARWSEPDGRQLPLLKQAGIDPLDARQMSFLNLAEIERAPAGQTVALKDGLWPGVTRPPNVADRGDETASASREPWIDANGFRVGCLRALFPERPPLLGYAPELDKRMVPFDTLELALIEAWVSGGNYLLTPEPRFREALLRGDNKALEAWRQLGRTARWLVEHIGFFRQRNFPAITALVEASGGSPEIANLLYRRNASPDLARADSPPPPEPERRLALVAANIAPPTAPVRARILAHAEAGASVIVASGENSAWWSDGRLKLARREPDRDYYTLGRGQLLAYHRAIADPSEFAFDVIDVVTHKRRAARLWNAPAVIAMATPCPSSAHGKALLHTINYGSPVTADIQARIQGNFDKAMLLRPEAAPKELKTAARGTTTEVFLPELRRLGVVVFS